MTDDPDDEHESADPDGSEYTWRDQMVGERMAVDQQFSSRVATSDFSNQEWGLIMTAVDFEVENPGDPEAARLVTDTSKVKHIVPELEKMNESMQQMGGAPGGGATGGSGGGSGGFLGSVMDALGLGGDGGSSADVDETVARADALTREYAGKLQERLEDNGKWEGIRMQAASEAGIDVAGDEEAGSSDETDEEAESPNAADEE